MATTPTTHSEYSTFRGRGSLQNVVNELNRQRETKIDFVADTRDLRVESFAEQLRLIPQAGRPQINEFLGLNGVELTDQSLQQIGSKCRPEIPWKFLKALSLEKRDSTADLLNDMFLDVNRRLVRCLDGKVRAFLSDRYRILDNYDLAFQALDTVQKAGGEVLEAQLTDRHMRLKFTTRQLWDSIDETRSSAPQSSWYSGGMGNQEHLSRVAARTKGALPGGPGTVHPLVTVSNSETGHGGLSIRLGIVRAICFNLATVEDTVAQVHLGKKLDVGMFQEETIKADQDVVWMKCRDAIQTAFHPASFGRIVSAAQKANETEIEAPSAAAVDHLIATTDITEDSRDSILEYFVREYDKTAYGLAQAVSRSAQDITDADAATELESIAGKIISCPSMVAVGA